MFSTDFLKSQTVLFVEDEELAREKLAKLLSKFFNNVITASNGSEGLEKFKSSLNSDNKIDLIISDINMPLMNGLEMLENIRKIDTVIPAIFTTARNEIDNILKAIDLNVSNYILKPIDTDVLLKRISEACEKKYIQSQLDAKKQELEKYLDAVDRVALIYKMDENGNITFANKSLLETSSYSKEEILNLNFNDIIHPDVPKEYIEKVWSSIKNDEVWNGNTKFITKEKEPFYLKNTIFRQEKNSSNEYITIGFLTTQESIEKREFQKKVIQSLQNFNKKEHSYKKLIEEQNEKISRFEAYIPRIHKELEEQKIKIVSKQRQLEHYELQMHNVDDKYLTHMTNKTKEAEEASKALLQMKHEKVSLIAKNKEAQEEIEATKKELKLLMETGEQKNKKIADLNDVIKSLETKIKELTAEEDSENMPK